MVQAAGNLRGGFVAASERGHTRVTNFRTRRRRIAQKTIGSFIERFIDTQCGRAMSDRRIIGMVRSHRDAHPAAASAATRCNRHASESAAVIEDGTLQLA
jgi:hypothetical protein